MPESDSPAIQAWREKQRAEIKQRDEESKRKKEEVVLKAEKAIDGFYERYNGEKERSIKKNKWVSRFLCVLFVLRCVVGGAET